MKIKSFRAEGPEGEALKDWYYGLEDDRGGRAHLRRARSPAEVVFHPVFHRLVSRLDVAGLELSPSDLDRLAGIAGLAANLRENVWRSAAAEGTAEVDGPDPKVSARPLSFARQLARGAKGGKPALSPLRFRRLLAIEDRSNLYPQLVRSLRLLDSKANLLSLANDYYFWGPKVRQDWAYDYYGALASEEKTA